MHKAMKRLVPMVAAVTVGAVALGGCGSSGGSGSGGGGSSSGGPTMTILYRNVSEGSVKAFQTLQQELKQAGINAKGLAASNADFYTKYLEKPDVAKKGTWDVAIAGWGPDWYGNGAASFFLPLFDGKPSFPPVGSDFGLYNSSTTNKLIQQAETAKSNSKALALWGKADKQVMKDAAFFPITDPKTANYHSKNIHNAVYMPVFQEYDPTNVTKTGPQSNTLYMLGVGDVDYMDPNVTYYSGGYLGLRMWSRQLYTYPATPGKTTKPAPDLASGAPQVSADGKTVTVHLRSGVKWNTKPARPVTASDLVLGVKRSCNPVQPFGGMPDFQNLLQGYTKFCSAFAKKAGKSPTAASLKKAIQSTQLPAVTAPNASTVVYHLTHPSPYFTSMLTLPAISTPAPVESLNYLPASAQYAQHTISDGPYQVASYSPTKQIVFTKNPAWSQSTDPIRKQNFDKIVVNETGQQPAIQQQLETGSPTADMEWDTFPPPNQVPQLKAKNDPNLTLSPTSSSNPYIVFNTASPNNNGALKNPAVRRALSMAISRKALIKVLGGPLLNKSLSHVLPAEIFGSKNFDLYPYNPAKAKKQIAKLIK